MLRTVEQRGLFVMAIVVLAIIFGFPIGSPYGYFEGLLTLITVLGILAVIIIPIIATILWICRGDIS